MYRRLKAAGLLTRAAGFQFFANSRFLKPPTWALARIHSPHGDSTKSHTKPGQAVFHESRITNHESRITNHGFCVFHKKLKTKN